MCILCVRKHMTHVIRSVFLQYNFIHIRIWKVVTLDGPILVRSVCVFTIEWGKKSEKSSSMENGREEKYNKHSMSRTQKGKKATKTAAY